MRLAKFFVGATGMAMYDALATGTFPVLVSRSDDHAITAIRLEAQGRLKHLGVGEISPSVVADTAVRLMKTWTPSRERTRPVDGLGVYRVARKILEWQPRNSAAL
jgi:spore coat polysaccharide biosynthesis predicted glycosyltransferase SpsG